MKPSNGLLKQEVSFSLNKSRSKVPPVSRRQPVHPNYQCALGQQKGWGKKGYQGRGYINYEKALANEQDEDKRGSRFSLSAAAT